MVDMRIAFFEIEEREKDYLSGALSGHQVSFHDRPLDESSVDAIADAEVVSVFIYSKVGKETLAKMPNVRLVTTRSMGYDHIDIDACNKRGIAVCRVPSYGERTVAEHAFALVLALSRKIFLAYERTEKGIFDYHGLQGFDLYGKTVGVVGGGKIGMNVVRMAKGFGMEVLVSDPFPRPERATEFGFAYATLEELLRRSDVVSLHAPYLPETHHMMNDERFAMMKRGAILVNTARGALIDTKALLKALENGTVSGAGLDVLEEECFVKEEAELMTKEFPKKCDLGTIVRNHMLIARNDVIITPHIAFNSREAVERILRTTVDNINAFAKGTPINYVQ